MESRTCCSLLTSHATANGSAPSASISFATRRLSAMRLPTSTTFAPSRANNRAVASPMPEVAPLIQATLLLSRPMIRDHQKQCPMDLSFFSCRLFPEAGKLQRNLLVFDILGPVYGRAAKTYL